MNCWINFYIKDSALSKKKNVYFKLDHDLDEITITTKKESGEDH